MPLATASPTTTTDLLRELARAEERVRVACTNADRLGWANALAHAHACWDELRPRVQARDLPRMSRGFDRHLRRLLVARGTTSVRLETAAGDELIGQMQRLLR